LFTAALLLFWTVNNSGTSRHYGRDFIGEYEFNHVSGGGRVVDKLCISKSGQVQKSCYSWLVP
jgi:hypothetical protein